MTSSGIEVASSTVRDNIHLFTTVSSKKFWAIVRIADQSRLSPNFPVVVSVFCGKFLFPMWACVLSYYSLFAKGNSFYLCSKIWLVKLSKLCHLFSIVTSVKILILFHILGFYAKPPENEFKWKPNKRINGLCSNTVVKFFIWASPAYLTLIKYTFLSLLLSFAFYWRVVKSFTRANCLSNA